MKMHLSVDTLTGQTRARGKSGRWYTPAEIDRAYDARAGDDDPEGAAFATDLDRSDLSDSELHEAILGELHDCPECRAALAAGVAPETLSLTQLVLMSGRSQPRRRMRLRRWRDGKKHRGR